MVVSEGLPSKPGSHRDLAMEIFMTARSQKQQGVMILRNAS